MIDNTMTSTTTTTTQSNLTGVYSNTGFDMIQLLSRLINRPNPQIQLGPIDFSCSFVVSDANGPDCPIIYCSPAFESLTGYTSNEIVGKNCRFLQSPNGIVECGAPRQHTDNQAVYYLKSKIIQGKEHQASIINYKKGGQPFVNLVTVIPLFDMYHQVEYFVGLQVDLVEQPNSILEKMKDGTYIINYHQPPLLRNSLITPSMTLGASPTDEYFQDVPVNSTIMNPTIMQFFPKSPSLSSSSTEFQKDWNKLLIDQCTDFIFVVSLKGAFLFASNSSMSMLEYTPEELLGTNLSAICHPSDIIPVMREIKETTADVNLVFRIRRKHSGYIWIDCRGTLHMDQSKSRKCLILAGRERPVYELTDTTHIADEGYWAKLNVYGLYLHVTPSCKDVVGFTADSMTFESIYQYTETTREITEALQQARQGEMARISISLLTTKGDYLPVSCTFYPGNTFILMHVSTSQQHPPLGIKQGANFFSELETARSTNWQYELYQLQQKNRKLKEQVENYSSNNSKRKRRKTRKQDDSLKMCAFCQRQDSPEWRKGPNGPKELCNACGLKYAKSLK